MRSAGCDLRGVALRWGYIYQKHKQLRLTGSDKNHVRVRRKDTVINTEHFWIWNCSEQNKINALPRILPSLSISTERKFLLWQWKIRQIYLADEHDRHEKLFVVEDLPLWLELVKVKKVYAYEGGRDRPSVCRHDLCPKSLNDSKGINLILILAGVMPTEDNFALDGNIPYRKLWPTEYRQAASLIPVGIPFHNSTKTHAIATRISWRSSDPPGYSTDGITNYATTTKCRRHLNSPLTYTLTVDNIGQRSLGFGGKTWGKIHHLQDTSTDGMIILKKYLQEIGWVGVNRIALTCAKSGGLLWMQKCTYETLCHWVSYLQGVYK
jgi:hypothetical protein